ncbi:MAG TPA: hypothetical protein VFD60_04560 [Nitrososphaeraceae archaeon]|nr:hypothetical protein [Nitrososphaeraceae archaeon]
MTDKNSETAGLTSRKKSITEIIVKTTGIMIKKNIGVILPTGRLRTS